ncbi:putative uncharacterized protein DDB_G0282129 [Denticeps clupeoides]|uniref:putative uncharacterized protein DDB_G0282129 n=1 Tax=Denticeps clupeoides TaxID=299321 RepID=UPI0010A3A7D1|nr:putative uncharacterized protein DDB_G0282129 [Denticeps clupeoides]
MTVATTMLFLAGCLCFGSTATTNVNRVSGKESASLPNTADVPLSPTVTYRTKNSTEDGTHTSTQTHRMSTAETHRPTTTAESASSGRRDIQTFSSFSSTPPVSFTRSLQRQRVTHKEEMTTSQIQDEVYTTPHTPVGQHTSGNTVSTQFNTHITATEEQSSRAARVEHVNNLTDAKQSQTQMPLQIMGYTTTKHSMSYTHLNTHDRSTTREVTEEETMNRTDTDDSQTQKPNHNMGYTTTKHSVNYTHTSTHDIMNQTETNNSMSSQKMGYTTPNTYFTTRERSMDIMNQTETNDTMSAQKMGYTTTNTYFTTHDRSMDIMNQTETNDTMSAQKMGYTTPNTYFTTHDRSTDNMNQTETNDTMSSQKMVYTTPNTYFTTHDRSTDIRNQTQTSLISKHATMDYTHLTTPGGQRSQSSTTSTSSTNTHTDSSWDTPSTVMLRGRKYRTRPTEDLSRPSTVLSTIKLHVTTSHIQDTHAPPGQTKCSEHSTSPPSTKLLCFITLWILGVTASAFMGLTVFLWVRLTVMRERVKEKRETWGEPENVEQTQSLWTNHKASVQERVEFWYSNNMETMVANQSSENSNQQKGQRKQNQKGSWKKSRNANRNLWTQPKVTMQDISEFWYTNGRTPLDRTPSTIQEEDETTSEEHT